MPFGIRFRYNLSVTAKFVIIYLFILAASLSVAGFILYVQASRSTIAQAQVVMEQNVQQTKDNISEKVNRIENLAQIITFDTKIQTFLGSAFTNESVQLEDYRDNIAPILENMMRQNTYIHSIRIYTDNSTIPELYDSFYHLDRIRNEEGYRNFIQDRGVNTYWRGLHPERTIVLSPSRSGKDDVYSFERKIFSTKYLDLVGLLEMQTFPFPSLILHDKHLEHLSLLSSWTVYTRSITRRSRARSAKTRRTRSWTA